MDIQYTPEEKLHLIKYDSDLFNRYQVGHQYMLDTLIDMIRMDKKEVPSAFLDVIEAYLSDQNHPAFIAEALAVPTTAEIINGLLEVDLEKVFEKRALVRHTIAEKFQPQFVKIYENNYTQEPYSPELEQVGKRAIKNMALSYLALVEDGERAWTQYKTANNFTDLIGALSVLVHNNMSRKIDALADFYVRYEKEDLALIRWFSIQASTPTSDTLETVKKLLNHPKFDLLNPNRVRALLGTFSMNMLAFHQEEGYRLMAEYVAKLDKANPHMAARLMQAFESYKKMDAFRRAHAEQVLKDLLAQDLSTQPAELIKKILK